MNDEILKDKMEFWKKIWERKGNEDQFNEVLKNF